MTASSQRLKNRKRQFEKRRDEKIKKLREGNKITSRKKVNGKIVKTTSSYGGSKISNMPKKGQRSLVLKAGGHGMGADYKKSEKKAFKEAEKYQKTKKKNVESKNNNVKSKDKSKPSKKGVHNMKNFISKDGKIISKKSRAGKELMKKLKIRK